MAVDGDGITLERCQAVCIPRRCVECICERWDNVVLDTRATTVEVSPCFVVVFFSSILVHDFILAYCFFLNV